MRLSIKSKIMINAGFTILVVSLLAIVIFFRVQRLSVLQEKVYVLSDAAFSAQTASQCGPMLYNVISGAMINHDITPTSKGWLNAKERSSGMVRKALEKSLDDQQQKNAKIALDAISEAAAIFETKLSPVIDSSTGITSDMQDIYMEIADKVDLVTVHMGKNAAALTKASAEATKEFEKVRQAAVREMILLPLAAVVLLLGFSLLTARSILRPLGNLLTMLRGIVNGGGLSGRLQITTHDETAEIGSLFNQFVEKLQMMILNVAQVADGVASAAARVSTTAEEMAASSIEAQSEAQAVAAASQELAATADDISANCVSAAERSKVANKAAGEGASTISENCALITAIAGKVEETAGEVEDLRRDSEAIAAIITTIEEIADYTNMLALNAAIEAARAGESGRGFAVVADEVRSLADRTTNATKEVATLVSSVQERVTTTVESMQARAKEVVAVAEGSDTSAKVITLIDGQVQDLAQQINQIATAAEEQTATTADISRNLQHINEVVEQASRGAKETSEASGDLTRLSQKLQAVVRDFEVKHEQISA